VGGWEGLTFNIRERPEGKTGDMVRALDKEVHRVSGVCTDGNKRARELSGHDPNGRMKFIDELMLVAVWLPCLKEK
jgi:hypothetical protein